MFRCKALRTIQTSQKVFKLLAAKLVKLTGLRMTIRLLLCVLLALFFLQGFVLRLGKLQRTFHVASLRVFFRWKLFGLCGFCSERSPPQPHNASEKQEEDKVFHGVDFQ